MRPVDKYSVNGWQLILEAENSCLVIFIFVVIIGAMTLSQRNNLIKISLFFAVCLGIFAITAGVVLLTGNQTNLEIYKGISQTEVGQSFLNSLFTKSTTLVVIQNILCPVYGFFILLSIYFLFEKTYVIEISFFIFFVLFLSLECIKLIVPLFNLWNFAPRFVLMISQVLYFSRFTALVLLLVAGIFIVTPFTRRIIPVFFAVCFLALAVTALTPFDTSTITSHFILNDGLQKLTVGAFIFFAAISVLTYFVAGKTLAATEYTTAAYGMLMLLAGYFLILKAASLVFFAVANILFVCGYILYIRSIHRYNLWQ